MQTYSYQFTSRSISYPITPENFIYFHLQYLPPPNLTITVNSLENITNQLPYPFILVGNFNAHHYLRGSNHCDSRGHIISDFLLNQELHILNHGSPTYICDNRGIHSHLGISICSSSLWSKLTWETYPYPMDSDHYLIFINLVEENIPDCPQQKQNFRWHLSKAYWQQYKKKVTIQFDIRDALPSDSQNKILYNRKEN